MQAQHDQIEYYGAKNRCQDIRSNGGRGEAGSAEGELPRVEVSPESESVSDDELGARQDEVAQLRRQNAQLARELALPVNIYLQRDNTCSDLSAAVSHSYGPGPHPC